MICVGTNTVVLGGGPFVDAMQRLKWAGHDAVEIFALQGLRALSDPLAEDLHLDRWHDEAAASKPRSRDVGLRIAPRDASPLDEERILKAFDAAVGINIPATTLHAMAGIPSPAFGVDMDPSLIRCAGAVPAEAVLCPIIAKYDLDRCSLIAAENAGFQSACFMLCGLWQNSWKCLASVEIGLLNQS